MEMRLAIWEKQLATWIAIIQECRNSGMKTKDWLAENNISTITIYIGIILEHFYVCRMEMPGCGI